VLEREPLAHRSVANALDRRSSDRWDRHDSHRPQWPSSACPVAWPTAPSRTARDRRLAPSGRPVAHAWPA
jgi:hypothetical protein